MDSFVEELLRENIESKRERIIGVAFHGTGRLSYKTPVHIYFCVMGELSARGVVDEGVLIRVHDESEDGLRYGDFVRGLTNCVYMGKAPLGEFVETLPPDVRFDFYGRGMLKSVKAGELARAAEIEKALKMIFPRKPE
ncbi:MAG: hypothetical protein ACTSXC_07200 [Candidatus Freyarchaeota archaeon]